MRLNDCLNFDRSEDGSDDSMQARSVQLTDTEYYYSYLFSGHIVRASFDLSEGALADVLTNHVVTDAAALLDRLLAVCVVRRRRLSCFQLSGSVLGMISTLVA